MREYRVRFRVNGHLSETIVTAYSSTEAKRIVEAQYSGADIKIIQVYYVK